MFAEKGFQGSDSWATLEYSVPDRIPFPLLRTIFTKEDAVF
jgi:hypothetical protein